MKLPIQVQTLAFIFLFTLSACDKILGNTPEMVTQAYFNAMNSNNYKEAWNYISDADKKIRTFDEFNQKPDAGSNALFNSFTKLMTFKVVGTEISGDNATATVQVHSPDAAAIMAAALKQAFASGTNNNKGPGTSSDDFLKQMIADGNVPMTTEERKIQLVKEGSSWKIFFDWKGMKEAAEKQNKIDQLMAAAKSDKDAKKLEAAKAKYQQVLELNSDMVEAKSALDKTQNEINAFAAKNAYIENVELYDFKAAYHDTYLDERIPGVDFKIKNKGDRDLKKIEVTVYFKDKDGNTISEETYYPVLVTELSFGSDNKPLKAGYIWQQERGKFYKAANVPDEWKVGSASAKITDIEFDQ